jgi:hypothetical protein
MTPEEAQELRTLRLRHLRLGDKVESLLIKTKLQKPIKEIIRRITGKPCNCEGRKKRLNDML